MGLKILGNLPRPQIDSVSLSIIVAGYLTAVNNATFWQRRNCCQQVPSSRWSAEYFVC